MARWSVDIIRRRAEQLGTVEAANVEQAIVWNRRLYDRIRGAGGVQYPVGAAPMASKPSDVTIRTTPVTICLSNNGRAAAGLL
jgi:hypothetical protein